MLIHVCLTINNLSTGNLYDDDSGADYYSMACFGNQGGRNIKITVNLYYSGVSGSFYLQIRNQQAVYYGFDYQNDILDTTNDSN